MLIPPVLPRVGRLLLGALLGASLACKTTEPQPVAVQLALVTAPPSVAQSGVALTPQPVVQVQDAAGNSIADQGRQVVAVLAGQGGTLIGTLEARTDATGKATFTNLGLSGPPGQRVIRFDSPGLRSALADPISVGSGIAATLVPSAGNFQTAAAGTTLPVAPAVFVADGSGNPVANVPVSFAVASGGGTVVAGSGVTNALGIATLTSWTLGTVPGINSLTATSTAIPSASAAFTATGILGPAAILVPVDGDAQSSTVGGATPVAPSAKLTDAFGNPIPGVVVTFAAATGGGSVVGGGATTNAQGIATVGSWLLGLLPGANTLSASRTGVPSITFHATGVDFQVLSIDAGDAHSCALATGGQVYCWGGNDVGQLGDGTLVDKPNATPVGGGHVFTAVTTGIAHTCALVADGSAWCWGDNSGNQLGDGTNVDESLPVAVAGGLKFASITAGQFHTCGLQGNGAAFCWGTGQSGRLGDGTVLDRPTPVAVSGGKVFSLLTAGLSHTCGLVTDGTLFCWGSNANGRLGDGTTTSRNTPTPVSGGLTFTAVSGGGAFTCAIATGGAGYCWGSGTSGTLGTGNATGQTVPTAVSGGLVFTSISSANSHTCALDPSGVAYCWGLNSSGELGDGTLGNRAVPTAVLGGLTFSMIRTGTQHSCAKATTGGAYCWGGNSTGALGDGTLLPHRLPAGVVKP